ncbi:hypothetical protein BJ165DRAFT_575189 [Panaeolus papilionaceus]|nr:hypothetical protein BJ165DRAFT_575189 [Panaeolus papilionaceus]
MLLSTIQGAESRRLPGCFDFYLWVFFEDSSRLRLVNPTTEKALLHIKNRTEDLGNHILFACARQISTDIQSKSKAKALIACAISVFTCDTGHAIVDLDHLLSHDCTRKVTYVFDGVTFQPHLHWYIEGEEDLVPHPPSEHLSSRKKYRPFRYTYSPHGSKVASYLAGIVGFDASGIKGVNASDMDRKDSRFECLECKEDSTQGVAYTWREAITHFLDKTTVHQGTPSFEQVAEAYLPSVLTREEKHLENEDVWICGYCPPFKKPKNMKSVRSHLDECPHRNDLDGPWRQNQHYFLVTEVAYPGESTIYGEGFPFTKVVKAM